MYISRLRILFVRILKMGLLDKEVDALLLKNRGHGLSVNHKSLFMNVKLLHYKNELSLRLGIGNHSQ